MEIMQEGVEEQTTELQSPADQSPKESEVILPESKKNAGKKKKKHGKKKPIIIGAIVLLVVVLLIVKFASPKKDKNEAEILTEVVMRGSITSIVEGNGIAKPQKSESIAIGSSGTVEDVYVTEGEHVAAGTVLYSIKSTAAEDALKTAQNDVDGYQKQLKLLYEAKQNMSIKASFQGKILEKADISEGDQVSDGLVLARLVDDSKMKLTQYYSYAYEQDISVGQTAQVSVPSAMQQVSGTVAEVNKVERISPEGSKLFCVVITMDNPGTLTENLSASAVISANGEQITPYELGTLEFNRDIEVKSKVSGDVDYTNLRDYMTVSAGQELMRVEGEDNDNEIFRVEENLKTAQEDLKDAQKNKQNLQATAPFDGTVAGLSIMNGDEVEANSTVISIIDTTQMIVEASVDERSVSYVQPGMPVEIDMFGEITMGIVESVGLNGSFENGMTTFPAKIVVDNANGLLNSNGSIVYRITASQSDDCLIVPTQCVKSVSDPETGENISVVFVKSETAPEESIEVDGTSLGVPETGYFAVPVTIGIADKTNVEILSGVEEGVEVFSQVVQQDSFMW